MDVQFDVIRYLSEHRITMLAAAEAAGMAPQNIRKCLSGNPKIESVMAVARGLNVDPREFFYPKETGNDTGGNGNIADAPTDGLFAQPTTDVTTKAQEVKQTAEAQDAREMMYCPHCGTKFFVVNVPNHG